MQIEVIISIAAVCVTLLLGILGFIVNSLIQRKTNSIQVITKTRLARREKTKTLMAKMTKLSNIDYLDSLDKKEHKEVINSLLEVLSDIRSEYSRTFPNDRKLIDATEGLSSSVISYLKNSNKSNKETLVSKRNAFVEEMDLYIQTEWKRIKYETVGKTRKNSKRYDWERLYNEYKNEYKE